MEPENTFKPQVNPLSEMMVQSMEGRQGRKAQDRLYAQHKKNLNTKKNNEEKVKKEAKENAHPKILKKH